MEIDSVTSEKSPFAPAHKFGRVGVLMGGPSTEREISLKSGRAVYQALTNLGLQVCAVDIKTDNSKEVSELIKSQALDCAFIALHGYFGEDGQIQRILDNLKIPYTGSGAMASKLAMDKIASHEILSLNAVRMPAYKTLNKGYYTRSEHIYEGFTFPVVIKPVTHGSSIGLSIVDSAGELDKAIRYAFSFDDNVLMEEYIEGREVTVAVLNEKALPVIEIVPKKRFFDFEAKYQSGLTEYIMPALFDEKITDTIQQTALMAHRLLGCEGSSRVDMIVTTQKNVVVLEVNTIPGLTETSLLPKAAKLAGMDFGHLCLTLLELAYEKAAKGMEARR